MKISPKPWTVEKDRVNPRYFRVHDADGRDVCRVYRLENACAIAQLPLIVELIEAAAEGVIMSAPDAQRLLRLMDGRQ